MERPDILGMRKRWAVFKVGIKTALVYRFHFFISLITAPIYIIIYYSLWKSIFIYSGEPVIQGFTFQAMVAYYLLNMIVGNLVWSDIDAWLEFDIRHGHLISFMSRPISLFAWNFYFEVGIKILDLMFGVLPVILIGIAFLNLSIASWVYVLLFALAVVFAAYLYFLLSFLVGLTAFWIKSISGIRRVKRVLLSFLSGGMLPLTFFPLWYQKVSYVLPFQFLRFVPINIFLGKYPLLDSALLLAIMLAWVVLLYGLYRIMLSFAIKKFTGVGQ